MGKPLLPSSLDTVVLLVACQNVRPSTFLITVVSRGTDNPPLPTILLRQGIEIR